MVPTKCEHQSRKERNTSFMQRLFCCSCLKTCEKDSCLTFQQDEEKASASVEDGESFHIIVEDVGVDNPNFTFTEVGDCATPQRGALDHTANSVSSCQSLMLKKLAPLSSMPLWSRSTQGSLTSEECNSALDSLLFSTGHPITSDGCLLRAPIINLIPPTPLDVIDDDQFFDMNLKEESVVHTSGSDRVHCMGSVAPLNHESEEEEEKLVQSFKTDKPTEAEDEGPRLKFQEEANAAKEDKFKQHKTNFLSSSSSQVPHLPEYPQKNDRSNKDISNNVLIKAELRLVPFNNNLETLLPQKKPFMRSWSLGEADLRRNTHYSIHNGADDIFEDDSPRHRRITAASYIPHSKNQDGNFAEHNSNQHRAKTLAEMNTEEVCQWFSGIGLEKCLPFIKGAELSGSHIACVDPNILEILHVSGLEERERLLSAIYKELYPPTKSTQKL